MILQRITSNKQKFMPQNIVKINLDIGALRIKMTRLTETEIPFKLNCYRNKKLLNAPSGIAL